MSVVEQSISQLLLPVELKQGYVMNKGTSGNRVYYITAANGNVVSLGIPRDWGEYIVDKVNAGDKPEEGRTPQVLLRFAIPFDCPQEHEGQVFEIDPKDGLPYRVPNFRFNWLVKKLKNNMTKFRKLKKVGVKTPLNEPLHVICTFSVSRDNKGKLADFLRTAEELLIKTRIITDMGNAKIVSWDGSRVQYTDKETTLVEITIKEYLG